MQNKNYYGDERQQLLDWLAGEWLTEGPVACFIEGFPGVGKSDLAAAAAKKVAAQSWTTIYVEIPDKPGASFIDVLRDVAARLADQGRTRMFEALSDSSPNPAFALEKGLRDKVLIVIDEVGRLIGDGGQASSEFSGVMAYLRHRQELTGRILFLSDVAIDTDRWSETFKLAKLSALAPQEAIDLLTDRLHGQQGADAVSPERMADLVHVLACNPRAIETLAVSLSFDPLEEIIGEDPGMWEVSDREVAPEFIAQLERRLLERTLAHLDPLSFQRLTMLAVHRKSFDDEAFSTVVSGARKVWRELKYSLISRFFVASRLGWNSLNPVVREIGLAKLKGESAAFKTAHSMAAEYYLRHFKAKQIVLDVSRLTSSYAELRYHMFNADRVQELRDVTTRLGIHLTSIWSQNSPVPQEAAELNERIAVLSALLEAPGPHGLEFYLALCLEARGRKEDLEQALEHVTRACAGPGAASRWVLKAQIHERLGDLDAAVQTAVEGLRNVEQTDAIAALYKSGADLLVKLQRTDDAILLLREGIVKVPPNNSLFVLYLRLAALLEDQGKGHDANIVLNEGIERIPADQNVFALYRSAALLLKRQGRVSDAIALLTAGSRIIPSDKSLPVIFSTAADIMDAEGMYEEAINMLKRGISEITVDNDLTHLYARAAELLDHQGRVNEAIEMLKQGIERVPVEHNLDYLYRSAATLLKTQNRIDDALDLLCVGMKSIPLTKGGGTLYKHAGALLIEAGQVEAGISWLKQGIQLMLPFFRPIRLYSPAAEILVRAGHDAAAVAMIQEGVQKFPGDHAMDEYLQKLIGNPASKQKDNPVATQQVSTAERSGQVVLAMATEWKSAHGGLSTFNRQLCIAIADLGYQVYCAVPQATSDEMEHAEQLGVSLLVSEATPGAFELSGLSRRLPFPEGVVPSVIIGHGRITGAFAKDQQTDFFKDSKRIHFVHMAAGEIEWFKEISEAAIKAEVREKIEVDLAADAQLVAAVGPRLKREIADLLRGKQSAGRVVEFVPGPEGGSDAVDPPQLNHCLVLGRAEDYELKGLDIAAQALSIVIRDKRYSGEIPELVIRGAPPGTGGALRKKLEEFCDGVDTPIRIREYSTAEDSIESDIRRAVLMLMPSRREGFGLVALEALSYGTPVLATDKSGFADVIWRIAPERLARNTVVETPSNREAAAKNWADAIGRQLTDQHATFARAAEIRALLAKSISWKVAAQQLMSELAGGAKA